MIMEDIITEVNVIKRNTYIKYTIAIILVLLMAGIILYRLNISLLPGKIILKELTWQYRSIDEYDSVLNMYRRITPTDISVFSFTSTPDGENITFVYTQYNEKKLHITEIKNGDFKIANINLISKEITTIIDNNIDQFIIDTETNLAWSPNGKQLIFSAHSGMCNSLYVYDINTKVINSINKTYCKTSTGDPNYQLVLSWNPGNEPLAYSEPSWTVILEHAGQ